MKRGMKIRRIMESSLYLIGNFIIVYRSLISFLFGIFNEKLNCCTITILPNKCNFLFIFVQLFLPTQSVILYNQKIEVPFPKGTYLLLPNDPKFAKVGPLISGAPSGRSRKLPLIMRPPGTANSRLTALRARRELALSTPGGSRGMPRRGITFGDLWKEITLAIEQ